MDWIKDILHKGNDISNNGPKKDVILVLGNVGSGKTTFSLLMTKVDDLISKETALGVSEYIITDKENRIGHTLDAKTVYPQVMQDDISKMVFYDFAGFDYFQSSIDIAMSYSNKKVIDSIDSVKIVAIVSYQKVRLNMYKNDFLEYVYKFCTFIKNVTKFRESIVLVVTKVESMYTESGADKVITDNIAHFFQEVKETIKDKLTNAKLQSDKDLYQNILNFLDILLLKNGENYERVKLLRRPTSSGNVKNMNLIMNERMDIKNTLASLVFCDKTNDDFGYVLADKSKNDMETVRNEVKSTFILEINSVIMRIREYFEQIEKESTDIYNLKNILIQKAIRFQNFTDKTRKMNAASAYTTLVRELFNDLDIILVEKTFTKMVDYLSFLSALKEISFGSRFISVLEFYDPFITYINEEFMNLFNWYVFLVDMYEKLLLLKNQNSDNKKRFADLNNHSWESIKGFIDYFINQNPNLAAYNTLSNYNPSELELKQLINILKFTLQKGLNSSKDFNNSTLIIKGNIYKYSDVISLVNDTTTKNIIIMSAQKLIIDQDITRIKNATNIAILAQNWEIVGNRQISLCNSENTECVNEFLALGIDEKALQFLKVIEFGKTSQQKSVCIDFSESDICVVAHRYNVQEKNLQNDEIINEFKGYLREALHMQVQRLKLDDFISSCYTSRYIKQLFNTFSLVHDLKILELQYFKLRSQIPLYNHYKSLVQRIEEYSEKNSVKNQLTEEKKVLNYLYSAALSKMCNLRDGTDLNLIIDVNKYLDIFKESIELVRDASETEAISKYKNEYKNAILNKINEANNFIENDVLKSLDVISNDIDSQIENLVNEVHVLLKLAEQNKKDLEDKIKKMKDMMMLRSALGAFQMTFGFLNFLGPAGTAVGGALNLATLVSESLLVEPTLKTGTIPIPAAVLSLSLKLNLKLKEKFDTFSQQIEYISKDLTAYDESTLGELKTTDQKIKELKLKLQEELKHGDEFEPAFLNNLQNIREDLRKELTEKEKILKNKKNEYDLIGKQKLVTHLQNVLFLADTAWQTFNKLKSDKNQIDEVSNQLKKEEENIAKLKAYEKKIDDEIIPAFKTVSNNLKILAGELPGKSQVALDVKKWKIQSTLKDIMVTMKKMLQGFDSQDNIIRDLEKYYDSITCMIDIYNRIETYHEQVALSDLISDIHSTKSVALEIKNTQLKEAFEGLDLIVKSNIVYGQYLKAMVAVEQIVFPFGEAYLGEFQIPDSLLLSNDYKGLTKKAIYEINRLKTNIIEADSWINNHIDNVIVYEEIDSNNGISIPLYEWDNVAYKKTIRSFLSGKEVTLNAYIDKGVEGNIVKFKRLNINLWNKNETIQKGIENILNHYEITMRHMGNSYYKCEDNVYSIPSDIQEIHYSFKKNKFGTPIKYNSVYNKLLNGDYTLAPYTLWRFKLEKKDNDFRDLEKFADFINIRLDGDIKYVKEDASVCHQDLNKYLVYKQNNLFPKNKRNDAKLRKSRSSEYDRYQDRLPFYYESNDTLKINHKSINQNRLNLIPRIEATNNKISRKIDFSMFNINSTLALVDIIVRKIKKMKYISTNSDNRLIDLQGDVLNLISRFEKFVKLLNNRHGIIIDMTMFDPIEVSTKLKAALLNGNILDVVKIFSFVLDENLPNNVKSNTRNEIINELKGYMEKYIPIYDY